MSLSPSPYKTALIVALALAICAAPARAAQIAKHDFGISSAKLANGLEIIVVENHALPLATIEVAVKNGAYTQPPEFEGLAHLYEHMFFKANAAIPTQEKYMERLRELGAQWNGTTSDERVNYFMTIHKKSLREGLAFMRDALRSPLFKEEELRREWPVVLGEFDRNEADPGFHLSREVDRLMWHKHYSRKNTIGDREVIFKATRAQMREIQSRYYVPNNSAIIIGGDVDPAEAVETIQEMFGDWARGEDPSKKWPIPEHPPLPGTSRIVVTGPVRTAMLQIQWHGPGMKKDTPSTFAADVLSYILAQPDSNFQKALVDSGLVDMAHLSYSSLVHVGPIGLAASTSADRLDKAWDAINAELEKLDDPAYVTDEQIESAKNMLEVQEIASREQTSSFCHSLSYWWCTGGLDYYLHYLDNLRKAGREDIARYVRAYIKGKPRVEAALVAAKDVEKIEFAKTAKVIEPKSGTSLAAFQPQASASRVTTKEFEVDGLKVVLRRNPDSETAVADMMIAGGLPFYGAQNAGKELVLLETLDKGSKSFSKEEANRQLARTGASLSGDAKQDFSTFALHTLARDLEKNFAIFADAIVHPLLDDQEAKLSIERRMTAIKMMEESPDGYISVLASRNFFKGHPYEAPPSGTEAAVAGLDGAALKKIHAATFFKSRMKLFVVGNVEEEKLAALVREGFKDLPQGGEYKPKVAARAAGQKPRLLAEKRDLPTNYIFGCFDAPNPASADFPALQVALSILSDRLFEEVRTKRNLTYAIAAQISSRRSNYGVLYVTAVKPNETIQVMFDEVERMAKEPISAKDLKDKVQEMITEDLMRKQENLSQAASLILHEANGGGWQAEEKATSRVEAVTPEAARAAAEKYLKSFSFAALGDPSKLDEKLFTTR